MLLQLSLLLISFPAICLGLQCHVCKGTPGNEFHPCADGEETEVKECIPDFPPDWHCRIKSQDKVRTHLGCEKSTSVRPRVFGSQVIVAPECYLGRNHVEDCYCGTNTCNNYSSMSFKCLQCGEGFVGDECEFQEIPHENTCRLDQPFCFYRWLNDTRTSKYRGCAKNLRLPENYYTNIANITLCYDQITPEGWYLGQECYCTYNVCNNFLNLQKGKTVPFNRVGKTKFTLLTVLMLVFSSSALSIHVPV